MPIAGSPTSEPTQNPYVPNKFAVPIPMGTNPASGPVGTVPNAGGLDPSQSNTFGSVGGLDKQLKDIWGKGVGGSLAKLLEGMSGTDSKVLQDYIASLGPEFAQQAAGVSARLGAGGVSANSSVNAIAQSNLASQENALIAGESAKLTMSQEDLTAQILMQMMNPAAKEVATSGWTTFANVMNQITGDIGNMIPGASGNKTGPTTSDFSAPQLPFGGVDTSMDQSITQGLTGGYDPSVMSLFPA